MTGSASFTITNSGGDMPQQSSYTVTNPAGGTLTSGNFQLAAGDSITIPVTGFNGDITLSGPDFAPVTVSTLCGVPVQPSPRPPSLTGTGVCLEAGGASFTVSNSGSAMTSAQTYTITDEDGNVLQSGTLQLGAGESITIPFSGPAGVITLTTGNLSITTDTVCAMAQTVACGDIDAVDASGFPIVDMTTCMPDVIAVERPPWTPISVGEAVCPDWLVYHTDMTGDWELFRLGELPSGVNADPNLSRGFGERVFDVMPSTSPDRAWVAFTSNRDGNWEIYISAVEEDAIRRITYNTTAVDTDPMWSPTGERIVYESNRDGNWELYVFDLETGVETRLTDHEANDVNAFWSYDGRKIVFQSDRDGFWQIYELDLDTLETRLLSDGLGDDHGPQYTRDGRTIVFQSYRDGDNSTLYMMDADGGNVRRISDPEGNAVNPALSPDDRLIAYNSNLDGDDDIYIYDIETGMTRLLTNNDIPDYAPTWWCDAPVVVFTSDITEDPNLFDAPALPIDDDPILVERDAGQLTFASASDRYPQNTPPEESASRQESFPSPVKNK